MNENLNEYCAPGTTVSETMVRVSQDIHLRVITFTPAASSGLPDILFIPGWISHIHGWQSVLLEMTQHHKVIYIETREKMSSKVGGKAAFTISDIGHDIIQFVKQQFQPGHPYAVFASSLGATLTLEICSQLNPEPNALILIGPNAEFRIPWFMKGFVYSVQPSFYRLAKPVIKNYLKHFRLNTCSDQAQYIKYCHAIDNADPGKLKKAAMAFWHYSVWPKLPNIKPPALIFGASKDKLHEPENLVKIAETVPNARYIAMETNAQTHDGKIVSIIHQTLWPEKIKN